MCTQNLPKTIQNKTKPTEFQKTSNTTVIRSKYQGPAEEYN